jgi:hypothetical protein
VSVGSAVTDGLGSGVAVSPAAGVSVNGEAVSVGVADGAAGVASTVAGVSVGCGIGVLVAVAVGVAGFTAELVNGAPPLTVTELVCACP